MTLSLERVDPLLHSPLNLPKRKIAIFSKFCPFLRGNSCFLARGEVENPFSEIKKVRCRLTYVKIISFLQKWLSFLIVFNPKWRPQLVPLSSQLGQRSARRREFQTTTVGRRNEGMSSLLQPGPAQHRHLISNEDGGGDGDVG